MPEYIIAHRWHTTRLSENSHSMSKGYFSSADNADGGVEHVAELYFIIIRVRHLFPGGFQCVSFRIFFRNLRLRSGVSVLEVTRYFSAGLNTKPFSFRLTNNGSFRFSPTSSRFYALVLTVSLNHTISPIKWYWAYHLIGLTAPRLEKCRDNQSAGRQQSPVYAENSRNPSAGKEAKETG